MVLLRVVVGVKDHFQIRVTEWVMLIPALWLWYSFRLQPDMFSLSPSYTMLREYGSEYTWGLVCFFCGAARLFALTINGTFRTFRYSPHIRMAASAVGVLIWLQFWMAFAGSYWTAGGSISALGHYTTYIVLETVNFYRSRVDVRKHR